MALARHHDNDIDLDMESAQAAHAGSGVGAPVTSFLERDRIWRRYAVMFLALYLIWVLDIMIETNRQVIKVWIENSFNWTWQDGI